MWRLKIFEQKIEEQHLERAAYIYLRQSTLGQVRFNQESTIRQYALQDKAENLGWSKALIKVLDGDLGISGSQLTNREDFKALVAEVSLGKVGAIFALEASRLSRSCTDWHRLVEICGLTNTLIIDEDGCYSPADFNDQLLLGMKGTMSQAELHFIRARLQGGKINKARRGELCFPLPVGYCYDEEKYIRIDNDEQVKRTIELLFKVFRETKTAYEVTQYFGRNNIQFPKRAYGGIWKGKLIWGNLTHSRATAVLKNPSYAGVYVYGRYRYQKKLTPNGELQRKTVRLPFDKWHTVIYDHHDAYIGWDEYLRNQEILKNNQTNTESTITALAVREGVALLQGLLICGKCGHRLSTRYKARGKLHPVYECNWKKEGGDENKSCLFIAGNVIDRAVAKRILEVVKPEQIDIALKAYEELESRDKLLDKQWQMKVERASYEAQLAQKRYEEVDPANRLVAANLEKRWNDALINLETIEQDYIEYKAKNVCTIAQIMKNEIIKLASDFPRLWEAETTKMKDRKRIIRLLIQDITVEKVMDEHKAILHIRWHGGINEDLEVQLPLKSADKYRHSTELIELVRTLTVNMTDQEIVEYFNIKGLKTNKGNKFTIDSIKWIRYKHNIPSVNLRRDGEYTIKQVMEKFSVSYYVVQYWIEKR